MKKKPTEKRSTLFGRPGELLIEEGAVSGPPSPPPMPLDEPRTNRRGGRGPLTLGAPAGDGALDPGPRALRPVPPSLDEAQTVLEEEEEPLAVSDGDYDTEESPPDDDHDEGTAIALVEDDPLVADEQVTLIDPAAVRAKNAQSIAGAIEGIGIQVRLRTARVNAGTPVQPILDPSLNDLEERVRPRTDLTAESAREDRGDDAVFDAGVFDDLPVDPTPRPRLGAHVTTPPGLPTSPLVGPVQTEPTVFMSGVHVRPLGSQPPVRSASTTTASGAPHPAIRTPGRLGPPPETRAALLAAEVDDVPSLSSSAPTTAPTSAPPRRVNASLASMEAPSDGTPVTPLPVPLARGYTVPPGRSGRSAPPTTPSRPPVQLAAVTIPNAAGTMPAAPPPATAASIGGSNPQRRPTAPTRPGAAAGSPPAATRPAAPAAEPTPANVRPATPRSDGTAMMVVGLLIGIMLTSGGFWLWLRLNSPPPVVAGAQPAAPADASVAPPIPPEPAPAVAAVVVPPAEAPVVAPVVPPPEVSPPATPPAVVAAVPAAPVSAPTTTPRAVAAVRPPPEPPISRIPAGSRDDAARIEAARTVDPDAASRTTEEDEVRLEAGYIRVLTDRKCLVIVDGQQRGYAPGLGQIQLAPGGHTLRCIVAGAGASRETDFRVDSGAMREIELRFGE